MFTPDGLVVVSLDRGHVYRINDSGVDLLAALGGAPNGAAVDERGRLYIAQNGGHLPGRVRRSKAAWRSAADDSRRLDSVDHRRSGLPNRFCVLGLTDGSYVTDATRMPGYDDGRLWRCDPDSGATQLLHSVGWFPNGIAFGRDDTLYVASTGERAVYMCEFDGGRVGTPQRFCELDVGRPDGLAFDANGNLLIAAVGLESTSGLVAVVSPSGDVLTEFDCGTSQYYTNLALATDRRSMVLTDATRGCVLVTTDYPLLGLGLIQAGTRWRESWVSSSKSVPVRSLLAGRPPEANVRPTAGSAAKRTVVLDDDPTGSQSVRDMPIITSWEAPEVEWAFDQPGRGFFVLTNSRSLAPIAAARLTTDVVRAVTASAAARDLAVRFVSRSDSTLRGHFPLETRTITETVDAISGGGDTIVVLAPAFPKAGRLTVDAVHWVVTGDEATPVGLTDYAADATFHYTSSDLGDWVRERTGDSDAAIAWAPLELVRSGVAALADHLLRCAPGSVVVVDAAAESDLDVLAAAVEVLEENGRRVVARGGPSIARALCGQPPPAPLTMANCKTGCLPPAVTGSWSSDHTSRSPPGSSRKSPMQL